MEAVTVPTRMNVREYFDTLMDVMRSPGRHFEKVATEPGSRRALFFLMISSLFYCSVSMAYFFENNVAMGVIMMANGILMPALAAVITFCVFSMTGQGKVPYGRFFNIYAYASGAVMVISWIPGLAIIMEPVRAVLVGVGLVKVTGISTLRAVLLVITTALLLLMLIWSAAPIILAMRDLFY